MLIKPEYHDTIITSARQLAPIISNWKWMGCLLLDMAILQGNAVDVLDQTLLAQAMKVFSGKVYIHTIVHLWHPSSEKSM